MKLVKTMAPLEGMASTKRYAQWSRPVHHSPTFCRTIDTVVKTSVLSPASFRNIDTLIETSVS